MSLSKKQVQDFCRWANKHSDQLFYELSLSKAIKQRDYVSIVTAISFMIGHYTVRVIHCDQRCFDANWKGMSSVWATIIFEDIQ